MEDLVYKIALSFVSGIGDVLARHLVSYLGSAEKVFHSGKTKLMRVPGIGEKAAQSIVKGDALRKAERELKFIEQFKVRVLFYTDSLYPKRLLHCTDAPMLLYYLGTADLNTERMVGVVGTRHATEYGKSFVRKLMADLNGRQIEVVSGLAYGIDSCAHQEAVKLGISNIGVLGHGLQTLYPDSNRALAKKMILHGGLITEYSSQHRMIPVNFANRNRIVAGMCDALVVVESGIKGGAVLTAQIAHSYNRDVFAVPGRIDESSSSGCNFLLKTHKAAIIESADDLMKGMNWDCTGLKKPKQAMLLLDLSEREQIVVDKLRLAGECGIDELLHNSGFSQSELAALLLELEMKNAVELLPGKRFRLA